MPSFEETVALVARAHAGQRDPAGDPYLLHVLRVALRLESETDRVVALLHDLLEDCAITESDLLALGYAPEIVDAVQILTRRDDEPYETYIERCASCDLTRRVKLADLADNIELRKRLVIDAEQSARLVRYFRAYERLRRGP